MSLIRAIQSSAGPSFKKGGATVWCFCSSTLQAWSWSKIGGLTPDLPYKEL